MSGELARDGFAALGPVLAAPALARVSRAVNALLAGRAASEHGVIVHNAYRRAAALADVALDGALATAVADLVGDDVVLFQDHVIAKPPGTAAAIAWHQDFGYWPLDAPRGLTVWIALDDAGADNGCLHYVAGSHRLGERRAADFAPGAPQPGWAGRGLAPIAVDAGVAVAAAVAAGAALVHDPLVWHMSPPNRSPRPRRAWSLSWIAAGVAWAPDHAPHPYTSQGGVRAGAPVDGPDFPRFARRA